MSIRHLLAIPVALALLAGCTQKTDGPKVMARFVPERFDDFAWENDLVCYRAYGQALEGNPTSPGFDIWVKLPGGLVADQRYRDALENGKSYHKDWGNGKDCYKVAVSLGGGASVPLIENRFQYPATNFRSWEILEQTDDKVVFVLHYPEWQGDGNVFALDKKITVTAGTYFCKCEDTYTFSGEYEDVAVAAGVFRHDATLEGTQELMLNDRYALWEHASDQGEEPEDGMIGVAVYMPGAEAVTLSHGEDHAVCIKTIKSGETLTYYFGSCWSKGDIKTAEDWFKTVKKIK